MRFVDLPESVVVPGQPNSTGSFSLSLCGGADAIILSVWRQQQTAENVLAAMKMQLPLMTVNRSNLILDLAHTNSCSHLYVDPKPNDPVFREDPFFLSELTASNLLPIDDFESLWQVFVPMLGGVSDKSTLEFIKQTWRENRNLYCEDALKLALELVNNMSPRVIDGKEVRYPYIWPAANAKLQMEGLDSVTIEAIKNFWRTRPTLSLQAVMDEYLAAGKQYLQNLASPESKTKGYVYILINASMPGWVKIGFTFSQPSERAKQLSGTTGVPSPFVVAFDEIVENCEQIERIIHEKLNSYRVSNNREFFYIPLKDAIKIVRETCGARH